MVGIRGHGRVFCDFMHLSMLAPGWEGGATPRKMIYRTAPWVGILNIHGIPISYLTFREIVTLGADI